MTMEQPTVNLTIDGKAVTVPKGTTVYKAISQLGIDVPIFCYQDRMPPFGACRVCLVEVEKMPKLQTSCTLEATEGMVVKTQSEMAVDGRKGILEFLLINHPLDCPICDRGGECPLQEQTLKFGPGESRFFEDKRHFTKAKPLGPVLMLDRERCIVCARCTRFGDLVAGDHALEFIERGYRTEVGTPHDEPVDSKFIGNTIMICPVGALTSQVYRFRARPWDNESTNSTCTLCPVGCSMILDARDGEIMRTRSCENRDVNDIWLCDKGWFGYEFTTNPDRLQHPMIRRSGKLEEATWDEALQLIATKMQEAKPTGKLAAFGGNPLTVEENYLFQQLMREGAAVNNLDHRIGMPIVSLEDEGIAPGMEMSIGACEQLSVALFLGVDITEEFPVIWLRLKQAINRGAHVVFIGHYAPEIARHLKKTVLHAPGKELETLKNELPALTALMDKDKSAALFVGRQYLANPQRKAILAELQKFQKSTPNIKLNIMEGSGNSQGARHAGMRPDIGPLGAPISKPGLNALQVLEASSRDGWDLLYVAGANPAKQYPVQLWKAARSKLGFLIVQDLFLTETAQEADVVLPVLSFVEKGGSFINIEGRVQTLMPGKENTYNLLSDGEIFSKIGEKLKLNLAIDPDFAHTLQTGSKKDKKTTPINAIANSENTTKEGALLATFATALFDNGVRMNHNPHVIQMVKEPRFRLHPTEAQKLGLSNGDMATLTANGVSIKAKIKISNEVAPNTIVIPVGFDQIPAHDLSATMMNGIEVKVEKV